MKKTTIILIVKIIAIALLLVASIGHLIDTETVSVDVRTSFHAGWFGLALYFAAETFK